MGLQGRLRVIGPNITNTKTGHGRKIQIGIELVDALERVIAKKQSKNLKC